MPKGGGFLDLLDGGAGSTPSRREPASETRPAEPVAPQPDPTPATTSSSATRTRTTAKREGRSKAASPEQPARKAKLNAWLPQELADQVRDCVDYLSGPPPQGERLTLNDFVRVACEKELKRRLREHAEQLPDGAFPSREGALKPGRRVA